MKKCFTKLILLIVMLSCASKTKVINLDVKENQLYIQDRRTDIDNFEFEVERLTRGLSRKKLGEVTFSLTLDGKSKVGIVSDLKLKIDNWKESIRKE